MPHKMLQNQELLAHVSIGLEVNFYPAKQIKTAPIPDFLLDMVSAGGLLNSLKQRKLAGAFTNA